MPALPGTSLTGPHPGSAGVPPASGPQARHMAKRATPTLSGFSSASPRQYTQGRPRRHWAPRAGGPARACRSCRRFAGLRPVAGKMPALPGTSLPRPHPGSAGVPPASGPQARHMSKRATPTLAGFSSARPRQCTQGRPRRHWAPRARGAGSGVSLLSALCGPSASGGGVAGSGVSLLSALCGPSARCGQDAPAPRGPRSRGHRSRGRGQSAFAVRTGTTHLAPDAGGM